MSQGSGKSPFDPDTHYRIEGSKSPVTVDGYAEGEPKFLVCDKCEASVQLTEDPTPGIDELQHMRDCPQRFAKTRTWRERFEGKD
ncbi:MAG: hypothetical protein ACOCY1_04900 [Halovenus sp.]